MATCKVYGYIKDGSGVPVEGILVMFKPASLPAVNSSTGDAIVPLTLMTVTTSTGYFEKDLTINTDFVVIINAIGLKQKIRIPDEIEKKLIELTATYTIGDQTPTGSGGSSSSESNW